MTGVEVKKILQDNGFVLAKVAVKMGVSPQNLNNLLGAADVKTGTLEELCRAINETIYFFYSNKKYEDIAPRPDFPSPNDPTLWARYEKKVEECAMLRMELEALKEASARYAEKEGAAFGITSPELV